MQKKSSKNACNLDNLGPQLRSIVDAILSGEVTCESDLEAQKKALATKARLASLPSNADILAAARPEERDRLKMLVRKPTRTLSGVSVIAAMTSPARCPHGTCVPCPGGITCPSPQSYTGREPAALRAGQHNYDPYEQVRARLGQLDEIGHSLDKAELIIMGGTMTSRPLGYQHWFIKRCLEAMNDYPRPPSEGPIWRSFPDVALANESAAVRNIGTTFETRPDWFAPSILKTCLPLAERRWSLGCRAFGTMCS